MKIEAGCKIWGKLGGEKILFFRKILKKTEKLKMIENLVTIKKQCNFNIFSKNGKICFKLKNVWEKIELIFQKRIEP